MALGEVDTRSIGGHVAIDRVFRPDPATRVLHDDQFAEFRAIYKKNRGIYRRLNR